MAVKLALSSAWRSPWMAFAPLPGQVDSIVFSAQHAISKWQELEASQGFRHGPSGNHSGGPGSLKVESPGQGIDIQNFTGEMQTGHDSALHGLEIDFLQSHSAAGHEFLLVHAFPGNLKPGSG
mgnify:CR=1 FL=1